MRQWLQAGRQLSIQNAAPLILKTAIKMPEQHEIVFLALEVVSTLAEKNEALEFERMLDPAEVLSLDPKVSTPQKRRAIARLIQLFTYSDAKQISQRRIESFEAVLDQQRQLTLPQKRQIAKHFAQLYTLDQATELLLPIVKSASDDPPNFTWFLTSDLLEHIIFQLTFSETKEDKVRMGIIVNCQKLLSKHDVKKLGSVLAGNYSVKANPKWSEKTQEATDFLLALEPSIFTSQDLDELVANLSEQLPRFQTSERNVWLKPIINLYPILSDAQREAVNKFLLGEIASASAPTSVVTLLEGFSPKERQQLLSLPGTQEALHIQPANLERFGAARLGSRRSILECFSPSDLVRFPNVFDETRDWDLGMFIEIIQKAAPEEGDTPTHSRNALLRLCKDYIVNYLPAAKGLYRDVVKTVGVAEKLISPELAEVLCAPTLQLLDSELDFYYKCFEFWKSCLPASERAELIRRVAELFIQKKPEGWLKTLELVSTDLVNDEDLRRNESLVKEIFDYAFGASEDYPHEGVKPLLELLPYLGERHLRDYVDRALDTLITYEVRKDPLENMEPFLRMVESPAAKLSDDDISKLSMKVCRRMLGTSNSEEEQKRILALAKELKKPDLILAIKGDLERLADSREPDIAVSASLLLEQVKS